MGTRRCLIGRGAALLSERVKNGAITDTQAQWEEWNASANRAQKGLGCKPHGAARVPLARDQRVSHVSVLGTPRVRRPLHLFPRAGVTHKRFPLRSHQELRRLETVRTPPDMAHPCSRRCNFSNDPPTVSRPRIYIRAIGAYRWRNSRPKRGFHSSRRQRLSLRTELARNLPK